MASIAWLKRRGALLALMVLLDFAAVQAAPQPPFTSRRIRSDAVSRRTSDQSFRDSAVNVILHEVPDDDAEGHDVIGVGDEFDDVTEDSDDVNEDPVEAEVEEMVGAVVNSIDVPALESLAAADVHLQGELQTLRSTEQEQGTGGESGSSTEEDEEDEITRKGEDLVKRREQLLTDDVQSKAIHIMEDVGIYNRKVKAFRDVRHMVRARCGVRVLDALNDVIVHLGEQRDVTSLMTTVALLQFHGCPSGARKVVSSVLRTLRKADAASDSVVFEERHFQSTGPRQDHCSTLAQCRDTGIPAVRRRLRHHPALLVVYDVAVAAIFSQTHAGDVTKALVDDVTTDLDISVAGTKLGDWKEEEEEEEWEGAYALKHSAGTKSPGSSILEHSRSSITKRSSCEDKKEAKAQRVISWIPFLGTLYNLISSAVYAGKGCKDVAKARAIEGTIDVAMDVATVVTAGAGAAAFQGVKAVAKGTAKTVVKHIVKKTFKKVTKSMAKQTLKAYRNPIKGAIMEVKDTVKGVYTLAKNAPRLAKTAGKKAASAARRVFSKTGRHVGDSSLTSLGKTGANALDNSRHGLKQTDDAFQVLKRCKRAGGSCDMPKDLLEKADSQMTPRKSSNTRNKHAEGWDDLWKRNKIENTDQLPRKANGDLYKDIKGVDLTAETKTNKELFQSIQEKAADQSPLYVKQNLGGVDVEYVARQQPYGTSKDQVLISIGVNKNGRTVFERPAKYSDFSKELDNFANKFPDPTKKRMEMAEAMHNAINLPPNANIKGPTMKSVFANHPGAEKAASEWIVITQVAEAVPGRNKGIDAYFRGALQDISSNGHMTFSRFNNQAGLVTKKGGMKKGRDFLNTAENPLKRSKALDDVGSDKDLVGRIFKEHMSDPDKRR